MQCNMCGKEEILYTTLIEGVEINVCKECSKYGEVLRKVKAIVSKKKKKKAEEEMPEIETLQLITDDYSEKIRKKREQMGMKQKEFAKLVSEKESVIHKLETGIFEPSMELARKLERILKIRLIDEYKEEHKKSKAELSEGFTLGDMVKFRKKS